MDLGLRGKGVVITGGSRGIGRAIALAFALEGANIAICARQPGPLQDTERLLSIKGVTVLAETCDVADPAALDQFLDHSYQALGRVDILVHNASAFAGSDDEQGWQSSFNVDLMAGVRATWKVVPWMRQEGGGAIIHIASDSGKQAGSPPPYAALKAALMSYAKTMSDELAADHIRVNSIAPGSIEFPGGFWSKIKSQDAGFYQAVRDMIPSGRLGRPEEVAAAVLFLASPHASWITGVALSVDGGQYKGNF